MNSKRTLLAAALRPLVAALAGCGKRRTRPGRQTGARRQAPKKAEPLKVAFAYVRPGRRRWLDFAPTTAARRSRRIRRQGRHQLRREGAGKVPTPSACSVISPGKATRSFSAQRLATWSRC